MAWITRKGSNKAWILKPYLSGHHGASPQASYGQMEDIIASIVAVQFAFLSLRIKIQVTVPPIIDESSAAIISVSTHQTSMFGAQGVMVSAVVAPGQAWRI
mgnify:CR=1 FL=1